MLTSGGKFPDAGKKSVWGQRIFTQRLSRCAMQKCWRTVLFIKDPQGMNRDLRKASIDAINQVNEQEYKEYNDPEILSPYLTV